MPGAWRESRRCSFSHRCLELNLQERRARPIRVLLIDIFPQVFPDVLGHFKEYFDDLGIELSSRPEFDFLAGDLK